MDHSDRPNSLYERASLQVGIQVRVLSNFLLVLVFKLLPTGMPVEKKTIRKKAKKAAATKKAKKRSSCEIVSPGVLGENDCSNGTIGEVAYFLYLKREEAGVLGTAEGDWLEAKKILNQ
ncbi:hypothetical protein N8650_01285 [Akkermansiaceae bacterium]|nr:hypothetical protein [Akkermansiaceae bacterium]MDA7660894.1 hypothetical protein [Akkermansiaceae bacterium]MDB4425821.1 hypothetical protein [bacterium]MDB4498637.1 hypothetical protein [bacterium]